MTVTIPVELTAEEQAALERKAEAQGVSVDSLVRQAVLQVIGTPALSTEEFNRLFDLAADLVPDDVPEIPDEALRRENLYTREDDWNRS
jgi:hypothetical protein